MNGGKLIMIKMNVVFIFLVVLFITPAYAGDWHGEGELGFTSTSGNTDSDSLNAKLGIGKNHGNWTHNGQVSLLKSSNNGDDSADRFVFTEKSEYKFAEKTFVYGRIRHEVDKFSGFDHQSILSFGLGHGFINNEKHTLEGSMGVGYSDLETDDGITTNSAIFDGEIKYAYKISETSKFIQNLYVESGSDNTYSKSETYLHLVIIGALGAKIGFEVKNNTDVPVGIEKTDKVTTITLVYAFK